MKIKAFPALLVLALALTGGFSAVQASGSRGLTQDHLTRPSTAQDVGLLFYRMTNQTPPYDLWIKDRPGFDKLAPMDQDKFAATELPRLEREFISTAPETTPIVVRSAVKLRIEAVKRAGPGSLPKNVLRIDYPVSGNVYFPYPLPERTIAVIPNGIELYREIPLTEDEAKAIRARLDINGNATLVLEIVPRMADGTKPMKLDGIDQWLMFGELGYIALYNNYIDLLWSYQAPSYTLKGQDTLLNLRPDQTRGAPVAKAPGSPDSAARPAKAASGP